MKFLKKLKKNILRFAFERKFNGRPLCEVQSEIQEIILKRRGIYLKDEVTARQLADNWNGTVQKPENLRFIKDAVPVVMCVNEGFAPYMAVMLQSILDNSNPQRKYHFMVFGRELSDKTKRCLAEQVEKFPHCAIDFIDPRPMLEGIPLVMVNHVSIDGYSRPFIPYWLDKYEKVIYLDSDMLMRADIAELYDLDLGHYCIGISAGNEPNRCIERKKYGYFMTRTVAFALLENWSRYINSGVLVFDTKKFAEKFSFRDVFHFAIYFTNRYINRVNDQDVLALLVKDEYLLLPPQWNYCWNSGRYQPTDPDVKIVHFNGKVKPWKKKTFIKSKDDAQEYRKYAANVPLFMDKIKDSL